MAEIKVTSSVLKQKADELANFNNSFKNEVDKMVGYEAALASMWEGDAQQAFRNAFNSDKSKMDLFRMNIDQYVNALRQAATEYEMAENKSTSIATTRK